jgi:hypothetical protein
MTLKSMLQILKSKFEIVQPNPPKISGSQILLMSKSAKLLNLGSLFDQTSSILELNSGSEQGQETKQETIPKIKDAFDQFSISLRVQFVEFYDCKTNQFLD